MTNSRIRTVNPAVPFAFLHGTDEQVITDVPTPLTWDHSHMLTSDFRFVEDGTRLIINKSFKGRIYRFYAQAGAEKKAGAPEYMTLQLYINGVAYPCCFSHGAVSTTGTHGDATLISAFYANAGDYIELYVSVDTGSATLESDTTRLIIEGLPMEGWDNGAGGRKLARIPRGE